MVYLVLFLLMLIGIYVYDVKGFQKKKLEFFYFILILLSFTSGLSYRLGTDILSYEASYEDYLTLQDIDSWGYFTSMDNRMPLWVFISSFFRTLGLPFVAFHLFQTMIVNLAVGYVVKKYSNAWFTVLVLYYVTLFPMFNYEIMRESYAVSVFLFSIPYLLHSQYLKYYICAFIAFGFHLSAFVLFLVPFVNIIPNNKWGVALGMLVPLMIIVFANFFTSNLLLLLDVDLFQEQATSYFSDERYATSKMSLSFLVNIFFFVIFPFVLYLKYVHDKERKLISIFRLIVIFSIVYCCTIVVPIFYRINNYFTVFIFIYLAGMVTSKKSLLGLSTSIINPIGRLMLVLFVITKIYVFFSSSIGDSSFPSYRRYYPYSSVFTKQLDQERERIYYVLSF